jgi:glycosyltransferase involved in cell wall biosynthesis
MKILQVVQSYYPAIVYGGPIFSIHYTCTELIKKGVSIQVATTNANGDGKLCVEVGRDIELEPNYVVRYYDDTIINRFSWSFTCNLWRNIKDNQLVHLQDVFSTYAAWTMMLAMLAKKPILISARGTFAPWGLQGKRPWLKKFWLAFFVHPFVGNSKRVAWHATSEQERVEILTLFPNAKICIIPNGIDCTVYDKVPTPSRSEYFEYFFSDAAIAKDRVKVLVGLGRLHEIKAFDVAIRALHRIAREHPEVVLLIAGGDDGERQPLEQLIAELGLESRVALIGEIEGDDKIRFLKGADLFFFPSHSENFGMVALEALTAGLPVVASNNTPWSELETEGSGLWVANTPEAFAEAATTLISQDLIALRRQTRKHAAGFNLATIADQFIRVYRELIYDNARSK